MSDSILLDCGDGQLAILDRSSFDSEATLRSLLVRRPDSVIPGALIDESAPRKWLAVATEVVVPVGENCADGKLDLLLLDQDGVPTLVEAKLSRNRESRRAVVGQLLEYAANATLHWQVDALQAALEKHCEAQGIDPDGALRSLLGDDDDADQAVFWDAVASNLRARRVRLIFLGDRLSVELRRVIAFLNEVTDPTEVLGVEVAQYSDSSNCVYVPRLVGKSRAARGLDRRQGGGRSPRRTSAPSSKPGRWGSGDRSPSFGPWRPAWDCNSTTAVARTAGSSACSTCRQKVVESPAGWVTSTRRTERSVSH